MLPSPSARLKAAFDEATKVGFPHYHLVDLWLPKWETTKPVLPDTVDEDPKKTPKALQCVNLTEFTGRVQALKARYTGQLDHVKNEREVQMKPEDPDQGHHLPKMPHPEVNFRHVDPVVDDTEKGKFRKVIADFKALESTAKKDGELNRTFQESLQPLTRMQDLVQTNAKGMQRLKLIFEWTLCQVTTVYGEINAALSNSNPTQGQTDYNNARKRYIALLTDLDDHEPQPGQDDAGVRGYGRAIKWSYIFPLIHEHKIKGAKIVARWNPHLSSSGIPIPH